MSAEHRVLVVGPAWVGDMVMAQSLFKVLARRPRVRIDVLAPAWSAPLLRRMPEVAAPIEAPFRHGRLQFGARRRLARALSAKQYHQAIVLPNSWKSALIPFWTGIPRRTGFRGEHRWGLLNDVRRLDTEQLPMTVQRFVALGLDAGSGALPVGKIPAPALRVDMASADATLAAFDLDRKRRIMALCPGAEYGPSKCWPLEYFAEVARAKLDDDWQVWLLGAARDRANTGAINDLSDRRCRDLAGQTSLEQVIDLLSAASLVISNDSGLMHIAAALHRPLLALFGSTDPAHTPPLDASARIVYLDLDCSPCFQRHCPLQHHDCMRRILPADVLTRMDDLHL